MLVDYFSIDKATWNPRQNIEEETLLIKAPQVPGLEEVEMI